MKSREQMPLSFAHRGLHHSVPENTMDAFLGAAQLGVDGIETDVRLDKKGTPILFHDRVLPDGRLVEEVDRDEISRAVGYEVPTLIDALDTVSDLIWNIEIKTIKIEPIAQVISAFTESRHLIISSFLHFTVDYCVRNLKVPGALLVSHCPLGPLLDPGSLAPGIDTIVWNCDTVNANALEWAARSGLKNMIYGFQNAAEHGPFLRADVSALITDFPERLVEGK